MFCVHKRGTVLTLPKGFRGTGYLPYLLLGVLKVKEKRRGSWRKSKHTVQRRVRKRRSVCLDWRHIHSSVRARRISSVPSALYTALITLTGPSISRQPHNSATAHINGKRKEKEMWGKWKGERQETTEREREWQNVGERTKKIKQFHMHLQAELACEEEGAINSLML